MYIIAESMLCDPTNHLFIEAAEYFSQCLNHYLIDSHNSLLCPDKTFLNLYQYLFLISVF